MLREVSSGVLKRPSLASVYFNIFNLDEDMEVLEGGKSEIKAQIQSLMVKKKHPGTSMLCMPKKTGAEPRKQPRLLAQNALLGLLDHIS
ncbi:uncharacterized protein RBU33_016999 isoform 2-T2 [Hipposideros larvatus]